MFWTTVFRMTLLYNISPGK